MNLSDKGAKKVYEVEARRAGVVKAWYEDIDFESNDFEGCVVLTVEEAKRFQLAVRLAMFATKRIRHADELSQLNELIIKKIEQAEGEE